MKTRRPIADSLFWKPAVLKLRLLWILSIFCVWTATGDTLRFRCDFDSSTFADRACGNPEPIRGDATFARGRSGNGLRLDRNEFVTYAADENFSLERGSLAFDFLPDWSGDEAETRVFLMVYFSDGNYLQLNKMGQGSQWGRLGGAFVSRSAGEIQPAYSLIADADGNRADIRHWQPNQWHHIQLDWEVATFVLKVDGQIAFSGPIARKPFPCRGGRITLGDNAGGVVDNFILHGTAVERAMQDDGWTDLPFQPGFALAPGLSAAAVEPLNELAACDALAFTRSPAVTLTAAPGEHVRAAWLIGSGGGAAEVDCRLEPFIASDGERIGVEAAVLFEGIRQPECWRYDAPPAGNEPEWIRYLRPVTQFRVAEGSCRQLQLRLAIPADQAPGRYRSTVCIGAMRIPVTAEVLPIKLEEPQTKQFGIYYNLFRTITRPRALQHEIHDLVTHGVTMLIDPDYLQMTFDTAADGTLRPNSKRLFRGLSALRDAGFRGSVVVNCGLGEVIVKFETLTPEDGNEGAAIRVGHNRAYRELSVAVMEEMQQLQTAFPAFKLLITTLDEVFNQNRLPLYCAAIAAAKQRPGFQYYATFHFLDARADEMRRRIVPYADYRSHHMYSWEWFLARGNRAETYRDELDKTGGIAGVYYNPVGVFYTPLRYRLMGGAAFSAGPLSFFAPWTYYSSLGDPRRYPENYGSHIFGFFDEAGDRMISTPRWEAYREGFDDLQYVQTLRRAISHHPDLPATRDAARFLTQLYAELAVPAGLPSGPVLRGTSRECPWSAALADRFPAERLRAVRREAADHLNEIQQLLKRLKQKEKP